MLCTTEYRLVSFADCFAFDNIFSDHFHILKKVMEKQQNLEALSLLRWS